ncbi:unnamed protein product [Schistosoma mattheei]|uniref:Uncharacterized protein n=1 Tax=Schistosoma mattheei TaxID=31246 RepID=A0A3P8GXE8_9TREM|nr:unnamed protein product [Schistosoma mattheei]
MSTLLRDEERLHEERTKALLARDRLMHGGLGTTASAGDSPVKYGVPPSGRSSYPIGYSSSNYFEKGTLPSSKCIYVVFFKFYRQTYILLGRKCPNKIYELV